MLGVAYFADVEQVFGRVELVRTVSQARHVDVGVVEGFEEICFICRECFDVRFVPGLIGQQEIVARERDCRSGSTVLQQVPKVGVAEHGAVPRTAVGIEDSERFHRRESHHFSVAESMKPHALLEAALVLDVAILGQAIVGFSQVFAAPASRESDIDTQYAMESRRRVLGPLADVKATDPANCR